MLMMMRRPEFLMMRRPEFLMMRRPEFLMCAAPALPCAALKIRIDRYLLYYYRTSSFASVKIRKDGFLVLLKCYTYCMNALS
jgi:hypothetical protein